MAYSNKPFTLNDKSINIPHDTLLEQTALGLMLGDYEARQVGLRELDLDCFPNINNSHRAIFYAISEFGDNQEEVDIITVNQKLESLKLAKDVGGLAYLQQLSENAFTFSAIEAYAKQLRDLKLLRATLQTLDNYLFSYTSGKVVDSNDFVGELNREITKIAETRKILDFSKIADLGKIYQEDLKTRKVSGQGLTGANTGFHDLNKYTFGFQPESFVIIAARPAVGKTAFALSLAYNMAAINRKTVGFFSLEMGSKQLIMRLVSARANVSHNKIITNMLSEQERIEINAAVDKFKQVPLYIDETAGISLDELVHKTRKLKRENDDLTAIFVDYIGLITTKGKSESRQLEIGEISRTLKELARELKITVIALSQLSRNVEQRENKRPTLSDLRESGTLEQDADLVLLMYREDYYLEKSMIKPSQAVYLPYIETIQTQNEHLSPSIIDIAIAKNRSGETASFVLMFFKALVSFQDLDAETKTFIHKLQQEFFSRGSGK